MAKAPSGAERRVEKLVVAYDSWEADEQNLRGAIFQSEHWSRWGSGRGRAARDSATRWRARAGIAVGPFSSLLEQFEIEEGGIVRETTGVA